jgi:PAS domain S-box-containing protein
MQDESYQALFERNRDGVFLLDQQGRFVAVNSAAETIGGYTAVEAKELTFQVLCAPDQLERSIQAFALALSGETHEFETAIIRKDGQRVELQLMGGPVIIDGDIRGLFVIARDISHRKVAEDDLRRERDSLTVQIEERNEQLQNEISRRATVEEQLHSLAAALSVAENRERERIARLIHDNLQQILVSIKYHLYPIEKSLADPIRKLVDSAIDASRYLMAAELSPPVLAQGLAPALEWLSHWMKQQLGLAVDLEVDDVPPIPEPVTVFLFQTVRELLFNISKHAKVDSARVRLAAFERELNLSVEDDGIGFDPNELSRDSTGFGLVTIRERISLLGGRFDIRSSPGAGCRFDLKMPLAAK